MFSILLFLRDRFLLPGKRFDNLDLRLVKHVDIIKSLSCWIKWNDITKLMDMLRSNLHCCIGTFLIRIRFLRQVNRCFMPRQGRHLLVLFFIGFIFLSHVWLGLNLLLGNLATIASWLLRDFLLGNLILILFIFLLIVNYFNLNNIITNYIWLISGFALFIRFRFRWWFSNYWFYTFNFISCSFASLIHTRSGRFIHINKFKVMIYRLSMPGYSSLSFLF